MSFLYLVFCYLTIYNVSEGRIIQGIIGRNVSFSWTINNTGKDAILILHGKSLFHEILPSGGHSATRVPPDRETVSVVYTLPETVSVTVNLTNITKNDAGMYRVVRQWDLEEVGNRVVLETNDETIIPKIAIVGHNIMDSTLTLECRLSNTSTWKFLWRVNESMIGDNARYSQNDTFLSIRNLTADDQYNLYKCNEPGSALESDPYNIKIYGPNAIMFTPNNLMVQEHSGFTVSCHADCYPVCSWKWTKLDISLRQEKVMSTENVLHIQNSSRQDTGNYSCRVLNTITGISLEKYTSLEIIYGPSVILLNSLNKIILMDEKDSITISCSADCFPPCQILWTETNTEVLILGADLKLVNVSRNYNYTCHATNTRMDNATISDTVFVIVKSGINYYTTTTMTPQKNADDVPSKRHLLYVSLGIGIILAVALLACLLHKRRTCLRVDSVSNSNTFTDSNKDDSDENRQEENPLVNYWTIVSNAKGELSTAIETDVGRGRQKLLAGQNVASTKNESEELVWPYYVSVNEDIDEYLNPLESPPLGLDVFTQIL